MTSPTTDRRNGLVGNVAVKAPVTALASGNIAQSGQQAVDGVAVLATNSAGVPDRVLCTGMADATKNGIWDVSTAAWTRSKDANGNYDLVQGSTVLVNQGGTYAGTYWKISTSGLITIGTTAIAWTQALTTALSTSTFLAAGAGAVVRGAQDKVREVQISVKDYGAVGDGATDDTVAIQRCLTTNPNKAIFFPIGTYIVSSTLTAGANTKILGEHRDLTTIRRTAAHTGHTLVMGLGAGLAGACEVHNVRFFKPSTFNGGSAYVAGTSTSIDNKLTADQAHIYVNGGQHAAFSKLWMQDMPHAIVFEGGAVISVHECLLTGSIWDNLTVGLQEGVSSIYLKPTPAFAVPTLVHVSNCYIAGNYASAVRTVTIGTTTSSYSENISNKNGIMVDAVEGLVVEGCYFGGQNFFSLQFNPSSTAICANIKINNNFFDGSRVNSINFQHNDLSGSTGQVTISDNVFNGETIAARAIATSQNSFTAPVLYSATISGNVITAHLYTPIYIDAAVGLNISGNEITAYNYRGGNSNDENGAAAIHVNNSVGQVDKVVTIGNQYGGGVNNLSNTNNCQYGVVFSGTFTNYATSIDDTSLGLNLPAVTPALVTGGDSAAHLIGAAGQPAFANAWTNIGLTPAGFWKDGNGTVFLQGTICTGTIGLAAFTLPARFRPVGNCNFAAPSNGAYGQVQVTAAGVVTPTVGSNVYVSLDGLSFKAA